ncbi:MAG: TonB system transport protein ExbD [Gammaproteobacteria bacterium]|nr:TonB system transport protein ExbD [Gammaproteobacteria bacterium]
MRPIATMNVIPFIDIMLVLLAIILTTATFVAQGRIPIDLPGASSAQSMTPMARLEITVTTDGGLFVDNEAVTVDDLPARLGALSPDTLVVLRIDERAAFGRFVGVIDQLKAHRLENVSILTRMESP